jgi:8-oxo-dGTP pyrophosphatase MutT (NUDIX family)
MAHTGKAKPGETDEACALREVEEETGLNCALGAEVAVSEYEGRRWPAEARPLLRMTPPADVEPTTGSTPQTLSYSRDVEMVERATPRVE